MMDDCQKKDGELGLGYVGEFDPSCLDEDVTIEEVAQGIGAVAVEVKLEGDADASFLPRYARPGDACVDIRSRESAMLSPGAVRAFPCGFSVAIPAYHEAQIRPRSGLALKHGVTVLNAPGTIDSGYRGEVGVILVNLGSDRYHVKRGDRIAQMVVKSVDATQFHLVLDLPDSARGTGGFGSTDKVAE